MDIDAEVEAYAEVADWLNGKDVPTGPWCEREKWDGPLVTRRYGPPPEWRSSVRLRASRQPMSVLSTLVALTRAPPNHVVKDRCQEDAEQRHSQHAAEDGQAQRTAASRRRPLLR